MKFWSYKIYETRNVIIFNLNKISDLEVKVMLKQVTMDIWH